MHHFVFVEIWHALKGGVVFLGSFAVQVPMGSEGCQGFLQRSQHTKALSEAHGQAEIAVICLTASSRNNH